MRTACAARERNVGHGATGGVLTPRVCAQARLYPTPIRTGTCKLETVFRHDLVLSRIIQYSFANSKVRVAQSRCVLNIMGNPRGIEEANFYT
ncbi:MAG: hypothetical protein ACK55Z_29080, partial [bacterium]